MRVPRVVTPTHPSPSDDEQHPQPAVLRVVVDHLSAMVAYWDSEQRCRFANRAYDSYRIGVPRDGLWRVRFNSDWRGYSDDFGDAPTFDRQADPIPLDGLPFSAALALGPYSVVILSQDG